MQFQVSDPQALEQLIERVKESQALFASYTQEKVDAIFKQAAIAPLPLHQIPIAFGNCI